MILTINTQTSLSGVSLYLTQGVPLCEARVHLYIIYMNASLQGDTFEWTQENYR